ncbi:MAG: SurA N-terminal domain-containing protein [Deltaproteobacteria bacterium]|nr:SurA N-terminal domain-containing protein [Deltaproteobacteria bacterium]
MLDILRRKKGSWVVKVILIAIALSFVIGFMLLPELRQALTGKLDSTVAAKVGDEKIPLSEYQRAYQNTLAQFKELFKDGLQDQMIQQLNLKQQVIQQMVDRRLLIQEALNLDLTVTDEELKESIYNYEVQGEKIFMDETGWFDRERYIQIVEASGLSVGEFEESFRQDLLAEKIRQVILEPIQVIDSEVRDQYRLDNEKVNLRYVVINPSAVEIGKTADAELLAFYDKDKAQWVTGERRKVDYLLISPATLREKIEISDAEIKTYYSEHRKDYESPEEIRARHVLIKVEADAKEEDRVAAKKKAEEVLARAKKGESFEELAKSYSEDPGSKESGGDLGFFGRGRMVKPFEDAAFALKEGEVSDLVESPFGYHIIRLEERKKEGYRALEEVKAQIQNKLRQEKSEEEVEKVAKKLERGARKGKNLKGVAEKQKLEVRTIEVEKGNNYLSGIPDSKVFIEAAEALEVGKMSPLVKGSRNQYLLQLVTIEPPAERPFEEVKAEVEREFEKEYRQTKATQEAEKLLSEAKKLKSLEKAAKRLGQKTEETGLFARRTDYVPRIGTAVEISRLGFSLVAESRWPEKSIVYNDRYYALELIERKEPDWGEFDKNFLKEKEKVLERLRQSAFQEYLSKLREKAKVAINYEAL